MAESPATITRLALTWLLAALTLAMLPHLLHLPLWLGALLVVTLGMRWRIAVRAARLPPHWLLVVVTLGIVGAVLVHYNTLFGRDAGVALLAAMVALKFLELRTLRDGMVLVFLGYFLVMANLLYSQSILIAAYLLAILGVLLAAQMVVHHPHTRLGPGVLLRLANRMLLQSIPIMLILFVLFPRIPGPLWGLPKDAHSGLTGLSGEMTPGSISQLSQSSEVAFRARFHDPLPPSEQLYWRGPVLGYFDGRTWKQIGSTLRTEFNYQAEGEPVDYTVILEPHGKHWLFALDLPALLPADSGITATLQLERRTPVSEVLRYEMRSYPRYNTGALDLRGQQNLPPWGNPRARALAAQWRERYSQDFEAVVRAALELFRQEPFRYTLAPPPVGPGDGIDEFLFATRQGFCEHYAGGFVFLMRAAGIPARVVTGYQGGERNALGDYFIVRQSDAHAWAEVWLEGKGWVRIDPTAAVAPQRVEQGLYAAVQNPGTLPFLARRDNPWVRQLALGWDALNNIWNEWVLAYGPERQKTVLSSLGLGPVDWQEMVVAMVIALGLVGLVFVGVYALRRRAGLDPVALAYQRFCAKLARRGLVREPHEGPLDFTERVARRRPDLAARVRLIGRLYVALRYSRSAGEEAVRRLGRLVRELRV